VGFQVLSVHSIPVLLLDISLMDTFRITLYYITVVQSNVSSLRV
jgi:hypothetical protein